MFVDNRLSKVDTTKVFQNAKLLLEQYNPVKWRLTQEMDDMNTLVNYELNTDLYSYIDALADIDNSQKSKRLRRRLNSLENSKSLVIMIDKATQILKSYPFKGDIYFHLIFDRYLKDTPDKVENILINHNISRRTYYRDIHKATEITGIILWGFVVPRTETLNNKII